MPKIMNFFIFFSNALPSKIRKFQSGVENKNISRFDVAMNYVFGMHVVDSIGQLRDGGFQAIFGK
jgi:hypothetical protein